MGAREAVETSAVVVGLDPGPEARLLAFAGSEEQQEQLVQRLAGGETIREVAKAWGLSYTRLLACICATGDLAERCKRVRELAGIELRFEGLEVLDGCKAETPEEVALAKAQAEYRERLSRDLHKPLFGKTTRHEHTHTVDLGERLRRARERVVGEGEAIEAARIPEQVVEGVI